MSAAQKKIRADIEAAAAKRMRLLRAIESLRYEDEYREAVVAERDAVNAKLELLWDDLRAALSRPAKPTITCLNCNGRGWVQRRTIFGTAEPAKCRGCKGTGKQVVR